MPNVANLGSYSDVSGSSLMFRNKLINGNFDIWQRGTSQTATNYGSDDRWSNDHAGSTKTASQQTFILGQTDVPANPKYFSRTIVTSSAGSGNYVFKSQKIEGVSSLSGQQATLSFFAKADSNKNIAIELTQNFGSGGSPSSTINSIGVTTFALTTSWKQFTVTINVPSISGKTLGSNNNDFLQLSIWFDAGSSFNSRTNSLGQQSGTFDIAQVQLEAGSGFSAFEQRPIGFELGLCFRYYYKSPSSDDAIFTYSTTALTSEYIIGQVQFPVKMRSTPNVSVSFGGVTGKIGYLNATASFSGVAINVYSITVNSTDSALITLYGQSAYGIRASYSADAEL